MRQVSRYDKPSKWCGDAGTVELAAGEFERRIRFGSIGILRRGFCPITFVFGLFLLEASLFPLALIAQRLEAKLARIERRQRLAFLHYFAGTLGSSGDEPIKRRNKRHLHLAIDRRLVRDTEIVGRKAEPDGERRRRPDGELHDGMAAAQHCRAGGSKSADCAAGQGTIELPLQTDHRTDERSDRLAKGNRLRIEWCRNVPLKCDDARGLAIAAQYDGHYSSQPHVPHMVAMGDGNSSLASQERRIADPDGLVHRP